MADNVRALTPVQIGSIPSSGAFRRDPIGASLDALQDNLKVGLNIYNDQKALQLAENEKALENIYTANELAGIEKTEQEVAAQFKAQTGIDVSTVTRSHTRRVDEGNGRIRGRKMTQELEHEIDTSVIRTPDDFQKAYDAKLKKLQEDANGNDALLIGVLERGGEHYNALQAKVFNADLASRTQHSKDVLGQEAMTEFDEWRASSESSETLRNSTLVTNYREIADMHRKQFVDATDFEVESSFLDTLGTAAITPKTAESVGDAVDLLLEHGLVTSVQGRQVAQQIKNTARQTAETWYGDPSPEVREAVQAHMNTITQKFVKTKQIDQKTMDAMLEIGGPWAAEQAHKLRNNLEGAFDTAKDSGITVDLSQANASLVSLRADLNVNAIEAQLKSPQWVAEMSKTAEGQRMIERYHGAVKEMRGEHRQFLFDAKEHITTVAADEQWTPERLRNTQIAFVRAAETEKIEEASQAMMRANEITSASSKQHQAENRPGETVNDKPTTWHQAQRSIDLLSKEVETTLAEVTNKQAILQRISPTPSGFGVDPMPDEQELARDARISLNTAKAKLKTDRRRLAALERRKTLLRRQLDTLGMNEEQRLYHNLYGGTADATHLTDQLR